MRYVLVVFGLLLIIPVVHAATLYSGTVYSGDRISILGDNFTITGKESTASGAEINYSSVLIRRTGSVSEYAFIDIGECSTTDNLKYCVLSQSIDYKNNNTFRSSTRAMPGIKIKIESYEPDIVIERSKITKAYYGESYRINVTFRNRGARDTTITYTEYLPSGVRVNPLTHSYLEGRILTATITVPKNITGIMEYTLIPERYGNITWSANYTYPLSTSIKNGTIPTISMTIPEPVTITDKLSKTISTIISADDLTNYTIILNNTDAYQDSTVTIMVNTGGLSITNPGVFTKNEEGYYVYQGIITQKTAKTYTLTFNSLYAGVYPITTRITALTGAYTQEYLRNYTYTIKAAGLTPHILTSKTSVSVKDTVLVTLIISNTDTKNAYTTISGTLSGIPGHEDLPFTIPLIPANTNSTVAVISFTVPESTLKNYTIIAQGTYRTPGDQIKTFTINKTINYYVPVITSPAIINATPKVNTTLQSNATKNNTTLATSKNGTHTINTTQLTEPMPEKGGISRIFAEIGEFFSKLFAKS